MEPTCDNAYGLVDTTIRTEDSPVHVVDDHRGSPTIYQSDSHAESSIYPSGRFRVNYVALLFYLIFFVGNFFCPKVCWLTGVVARWGGDYRPLSQDGYVPPTSLSYGDG